jgi:histone deacetylase 1/2
MSSSSTSWTPAQISQLITVKLGRDNYLLWKAQVLPAFRGAQLLGFLTGKVKAPSATVAGTVDGKTAQVQNPEYDEWLRQDQIVLSVLLASLTPEILARVLDIESGAGVWLALERTFSSQSRARVMQLRRQLAQVQRGSSSITDHFNKVKSLTDALAAAGSPLSDEEIVNYVLSGVGDDFGAIVAAIGIKDEEISPDELYAYLLSYEAWHDPAPHATIGNTSANNVSRSNRGGRGRGNYQQNSGRGNGNGGAGGYNSGNGGGYGGGRGNGGGNSGGGSSGGRNSFNNDRRPKPVCQVCTKPGHSAAKCWFRYDESYQGEEAPRSAAAASMGGGGDYNFDPTWYSDTGATDHITHQLDRLNTHEKYLGRDNVKAANGTGMTIANIGKSIINTNSRPLLLNDVLHVPKTTKNLLSVHKLTRDNDVFIEYHPWYFLVKDRLTRRVLARGSSRGGLYPFGPGAAASRKFSFSATTSSELWHRRLGHPAQQVVQQIIRAFNLPCVSRSKNNPVCDACMQAKSHQLPFSMSNHVSTSPLELVYSDVWGPAINSVGGYKYYVSFIDDFSKFTWIYLLKRKSEVFNVFTQFQKLTERLLNKKIVSVQTDWGGEYQKLHKFFHTVGITHRVSCPHTHQQNGSAERKHRHIVDVGLSLLAQSSLPLRFWDTAFQTATYLINRMPSRVINQSTPLELLRDIKPDYSFLKVFGCVCWPNLRPYNTRKLNFRSKQCVFIGYSDIHRGYRCLHPPTGRIYISRDVTFDEHACLSLFTYAKINYFTF